MFSKDENHLSPLVNKIAARLGSQNASKTFYSVDLEAIESQQKVLDYWGQSSSRCSMVMTITDDAIRFEEFMNVSVSRGLIRKDRKHLFISSSSAVKNVVYGMEEFQFHGHAG